jgi:hypothetical protein
MEGRAAWEDVDAQCALDHVQDDEIARHQRQQDRQQQKIYDDLARPTGLALCSQPPVAASLPADEEGDVVLSPREGRTRSKLDQMRRGGWRRKRYRLDHGGDEFLGERAPLSRHERIPVFLRVANIAAWRQRSDRSTPRWLIQNLQSGRVLFLNSNHKESLVRAARVRPGYPPRTRPRGSSSTPPA